MKERPILFSGPMVRAILEGSKTMTRRVVKPQPPTVFVPEEGFVFCDEEGIVWGRQRVLTGCGSIDVDAFPFPSIDSPIPCPYGQPGDRMWVRETFGIFDSAGNERTVVYRADGDDGPGTWLEVPEDKYFNDDYFPADERWRPSIHMPRWASRITLEITDVRVERVQEITEKDSALEGTLECDGLFDEAEYCRLTKEMGDAMGDLTPAFRQLWDSINGKTHPWESNPWVWVISFKRID